MEDKTGKLWFGTRGEPCFYDGKTFTVLKNKDGKGFRNVWSIIEDKKGSIWFGDNDGLWRYDSSTVTKVSQKGAYAIIQDKKGNIWTTGEVNPGGGGVWALSRYDAKSLYNKKPTVTEIKSRGIMALLVILEANDGSICPPSQTFHRIGRCRTNGLQTDSERVQSPSPRYQPAQRSTMASKCDRRSSAATHARPSPLPAPR
jgi:ligand-binding sensor domain-containing protein